MLLPRRAGCSRPWAKFVATNFAHGREQPALRGKSIADNGEISNPAVMRKFGIHGTQRRLNGCGFELPGHEYAEIAAPIADHHDLLRRGKKPDDFFLDRFGRYVVPGIQNDQVLDAAADAPISAHVDFALVAGVKPSVMQRAGSFLWAIPVARENVWPAHDDLLIFSELHLDPANGRADVARLDGHARVIQRANPGGFRKPIGLEHRNA